MIHFIKYMFLKIKNQSIGRSIVSFLFLFVGVISITLLVSRSQLIPTKIADVDETILYLLIGIILLYIITFIQFIELLYYFIFSKEINVIAGMNVGDSIYKYRKTIDKKTKLIILVSQNFKSAMDKDFKEKAIEMIKRKNSGKVLLIGTTFSAMKEICPGAELDSLSSIKDIKEMYEKLDAEEREFLRVVFHPSASSLTVFFHDPNHNKIRRRLAILGPKFAQDQNAPNRLFCIIEPWRQKDIFESFLGHLQYMTNPNKCQSLNEFCNIIKNKLKVYSNAPLDEQEAIDYFCDNANIDLSVFNYLTWYE